MKAAAPTALRAEFIREGLHRCTTPLTERALKFLRTQAAAIPRLCAGRRPWHYWELHNPWGRAGTAYDSWGFLDLCRSPVVLDLVTSLMGLDIVLFDSEWLPHPWRSLESDAHRFAVDPVQGLTVLLCFGAERESATYLDFQNDDSHRPVSLRLEPGQLLAADCHLPYCVRSLSKPPHPTLYAIRYFAPISRYIRDPAAPVQRALTDRYPLLNYTRMPLWLVHGEDRAGNDFVTGFNVRAGYWTTSSW